MNSVTLWLLKNFLTSTFQKELNGSEVPNSSLTLWHSQQIFLTRFPVDLLINSLVYSDWLSLYFSVIWRNYENSESPHGTG